MCWNHLEWFVPPMALEQQLREHNILNAVEIKERFSGCAPITSPLQSLCIYKLMFRPFSYSGIQRARDAQRALLLRFISLTPLGIIKFSCSNLEYLTDQRWCQSSCLLLQCGDWWRRGSFKIPFLSLFSDFRRSTAVRFSEVAFNQNMFHLDRSLSWRAEPVGTRPCRFSSERRTSNPNLNVIRFQRNWLVGAETL